VEPRSIYVREGDGFVPTDLARGPWDPSAQHGGAPAALLCRAVEQESPLPLVRLTVELLRPVPLAPLRVAVHELRPGRRVAAFDATLSADDAVVAVARALAIRRESDVAPAVPWDGPPPAPPPESTPGEPISAVQPMFAGGGTEIRFARGSYREPGPAFAWLRLRVPLVEGEAPSPFQRVAAAADFGNGVSAALDWDTQLFINPDVTIYVYRLPEGEWVGLDAATAIESDGVGMAESRLYDERGPIGRAVQALLAGPR
jgi:hypothetical protein